MADGDPVDVTPAALITHAGHLDTLAGHLTTAHQAGATVQLDAQAYGQLCTIVPALLNGLQTTALSGIDAAATSVSDAATGLRSIALLYQSTDQANADDIASAYGG